MVNLPRCTISDDITRNAGVTRRCYALTGNQPARLRHGQVFTVDCSISPQDGGLSDLSIPYEPLAPGPAGALFEVDATDSATSICLCRPDLDRRGPDDFCFDQGLNETHCRNAYFVAMSTYEAFRHALGRPVAWAFWGEGHYPPLRLMPFAEQALNAYYDRDAYAVGFGYSPAGQDSHLADRQLIRFTALSSDIVAHEVTHALIDGLRPNYDMPVHPDVHAFHEALADIVALLSRFERPGYLEHLLRKTGTRFLRERSLISLAPQLGHLVRKSGLRTLDVGWTEAGETPDQHLLGYANAPLEPHERGGLLSSAVFEAFLHALDRRIRPLLELAAPDQSAVGRHMIQQIQHRATRTAGHFLSICIRAIDYCPPATILFPDYLRALVTADRVLVSQDHHGYREELINAFRRRGIYPDGINVVSERALTWDPPNVPVYPIPGLAMSQLRYDVSPVFPPSADEIHRQARALANAIDSDAALARELGLSHPNEMQDGMRISAPMITSIRPTLRIGPDGFFDFSVIAEIVQSCDSPIDDQGVLQHRGGATLILDPKGQPSLIIRQRSDNQQRFAAETEHVRRAIRDKRMIAREGRYVPGSRMWCDSLPPQRKTAAR